MEVIKIYLKIYENKMVVTLCSMQIFKDSKGRIDQIKQSILTIETIISKII